MAYVVGRGTSVDYGVETTFGTAVTGVAALALLSSTLKETVKFVDAPDLHDGTGGTVARINEESREVSGDLVFSPSYVGMGTIFDCGIGTHSASSGAGPYVHTWVSAVPETLSSFTGILKQGSSSHLSTYSGLMVSKLSFEWPAGQPGKVTASLIGKALDGYASGSPTSPTSIVDVISRQGATGLTWGVGTPVTYSNLGDIRIDIDNGLEAVPTVGSAYTAQPAPSKRKEIMFSATLRLTSAAIDTMIDSYRTGETGTLAITFTGTDNYRWTFSATNCQCMSLDYTLSGLGIQVVKATWKVKSGALTMTQRNDSANWYS